MTRIFSDVMQKPRFFAGRGLQKTRFISDPRFFAGLQKHDFSQAHLQKDGFFSDISALHQGNTTNQTMFEIPNN